MVIQIKVVSFLGGHLHLFHLKKKPFSWHCSSADPFVGTNLITLRVSSLWLRALPTGSSFACLISINSSSNFSSDSLCFGKDRNFGSQRSPEPQRPVCFPLATWAATSLCIQTITDFLRSPHSQWVWLQHFLFLTSPGSWSWNILHLHHGVKQTTFNF